MLRLVPLPGSLFTTRLRTRAAQLLLLAFFLALPVATAQSGTFGMGGLGGGMPWEGPLQQLLSSLTGPVSQRHRRRRHHRSRHRHRLLAKAAR